MKSRAVLSLIPVVIASMASVGSEVRPVRINDQNIVRVEAAVAQGLPTLRQVDKEYWENRTLFLTWADGSAEQNSSATVDGSKRMTRPVRYQAKIRSYESPDEARAALEELRHAISRGSGQPKKGVGDVAYEWLPQVQGGSTVIRFATGVFMVDVSGPESQMTEKLAHYIAKSVVTAEPKK